MKKSLLPLIILLALLIAGCAVDRSEQASPEPGDDGPDLPAVTEPAPATETPDQDVQDGYPGPDQNGYPAPSLPTPFPPGYPAPVIEPTIDPYPGGLAIVVLPAGQQCQEPTYPDQASALATLEDAGILVREISEVELMVCEACTCPTSLHYRALINPEDIALALSLGWQRAYQ